MAMDYPKANARAMKKLEANANAIVNSRWSLTALSRWLDLMCGSPLDPPPTQLASKVWASMVNTRWHTKQLGNTRTFH
jgi:hypothetical protein